MKKHTQIFPDITECLYTSNSAIEASERYIKKLRSVGGFSNNLYATKLEDYLRLLKNEEFLRKFQDDTVELCEYFRHNCSYHVEFYMRVKSFISINQKIRLFISEDDPLSDINDVFASRIVVGNSNEEKAVESCYEIIKFLFYFFIEKKYYPVKKEFKNQEFQGDGIYVPTQSPLDDWGHKNYVKDYIKYPKKNGYQSLHSLFVSSYGFEIEFQVRTKKEDEFANEKNHSRYKNERYKQNIIVYNPEKVIDELQEPERIIIKLN